MYLNISSALLNVLNTYNNTKEHMNYSCFSYSQRLYAMTTAYSNATATIEHKLCLVHAYVGNALLNAATHHMGEAAQHAQAALDIQQNSDALYERLATLDYRAIAKRVAVLLGKALLLLLWVAVAVVTVAGYAYYWLLRYLAVEMGSSVDEAPATPTATVDDVPAALDMYDTYLQSYETVCGPITSDDEYEQLEREFATPASCGSSCNNCPSYDWFSCGCIGYNEYSEMEREFAEALAAQEKRHAAAARRAARKAARKAAGIN